MLTLPDPRFGAALTLPVACTRVVSALLRAIADTVPRDAPSAASVCPASLGPCARCLLAQMRLNPALLLRSGG